MKLETKYSPGNTVWSIGRSPIKTWVMCSFCAGNGTTTGQDGKVRSCPKCYNNKGQYKHGNTVYQVEGILTVGQVRISYTKSEGVPGHEIFDNMKAQEHTEEEYMCVETGIGSGSVYKVEILWPSKMEAQVECDRLNLEAK